MSINNSLNTSLFKNLISVLDVNLISVSKVEDGVKATSSIPISPDSGTAVQPATSFQPSRTARVLSYLTSPKTIAGTIGAGVAALAGCAAPACLVVGGAVVTIQQLFIKTVSGGKTLRSAAYIQADHLSRMNIQGGFRSMIIPQVLQALDKMDSANAIKAKSALHSFLTFEEYFDYLGINNHFLVQDFIQKVEQLQPGQIVAWTLSYMKASLKNYTPTIGGHVILGSIERTVNGKYLLRIHNGGEGVSTYHYRRYEKESGRLLFQTTLEIDDIAFPELVTFIKAAAANQAFRPSNSVEKLYELTSALKGKYLPPREDPRFWMRPQMGNSCSGYSVKCFLRVILSKEEYITFRKQFLVLCVDNLKKGLEKGWFFEKTEEHRLVFKELNAKLMRLEGIERTVATKSSVLVRAAAQIQKKFWNSVFPISFETFHNMKLGLDTDEFIRLSKHQFFKRLSDSYREVDAARNKENVETFEKCQKAFQLELHDFYQKLDKSKYSVKEQSELEKCVLEIQKTGKILKLNCDYQSCHLYHFYKLVFRKCSMVLTDALATRLKEVIDHLNTQNFKEARAILEGAFKLGIPDSQKLTEKQKEELEFTLCQTLYLEDSLVLEDMDLRAGLAILFQKMDFIPPYYLTKNMGFFQELRFDQAFPDTPWAKMIVEYLKSSLTFPKDFSIF